MLCELQALTSATCFGMPRRTATGFDYNRLNMLIAVLEKRVGLNLSNQDVYINVVGGLKVTEPAADLAVCVSVASSFRNFAIAEDTALVGEIGLTGELRSVSHIEKRIKEAEKLGFKNIIIPKANENKALKSDTINITCVKTVTEALGKLM